MTDLNPLITAIIVSYNSFSTLRRCQNDWLESPPCKIIIVDNASTDSSAADISQHYPQVNLMKQAINLGYGRGANRALAEVDTPYAILLNPDLEVSEQHIRQLVDSAAKLDGEFAILAPAVREKDHLKQGLVRKKWVIGAAMLFNMKAMQEIGFFDESIFLFSEETDLCMRTNLLGKAIFLDSNIYIRHLLNQSSTPNPETTRLKNWHKGWSRMYFRNKHGLNKGKKSNWRVLAKYALKRLLSTKTDKRLAYKYRLAGSIAFLKGTAALRDDGRPRT